MSADRTEYQSEAAQSAAEKLSIRATTPPAAVPGYRLQKFLGAGAFGQVWVGQDLNTGRPVAVKFYLHRGGVNWSLLSREVKNLVQLSANRHVVQVLEVGWDADPPYYVMELVKGGSLEDLLELIRTLTVSDAVEMFRKIVIGLNHCHSKGVLHCDLKPANILLGEDREPRLADFGQSRMSHDQTPALGTLFYMAPEQADLNSTPEASWDVYAAGAILYRLLTGQPPYRNEEVLDGLDTAGSLPVRLARYRESIDRSDPPREHLRVFGVDRMLGRIVNRCLAAKPADRYENVQQILDDLNRRDEVRARRPLMLLGIVGPMLILLATCFFAARSIEQASNSTMAALRTEAYGSNQLAANFAARTLESEIERYFEATRREAVQPDFLALLDRSLQHRGDKADRDLIGSSAVSPEKKAEIRERFLDSPSRLELDQWLADRHQGYMPSQGTSRKPHFTSIFLIDSQGTIFATSFDEPIERSQNSAGRNFAFRTYFHGGRDDLPRATPIESIQPTKRPHLSAAFQSTTTGIWKVAISSPIYLSEESDRPDAIFVATINLGEFRLLQSEQGANQIAVLVEARDGPLRGTILQHPLMDARLQAGGTMAGERFQLKATLIDRILEGGDVDYRDPLASAPDGSDYAGDWIVAMQPVDLPIQEVEQRAVGNGVLRSTGQASDIANESKSDLMVLVQYRLSKVMAPVGQMRQRLLSEGAAAVVSVLLVALALWFFVHRAHETKAIAKSRQDEETGQPTGETETIAV